MVDAVGRLQHGASAQGVGQLPLEDPWDLLGDVLPIPPCRERHGVRARGLGEWGEDGGYEFFGGYWA